MESTSLKAYVWTVVGVSAWSLSLVDWTALGGFTPDAWQGLAALVALGLLSESLALTIRVGQSGRSSSSITFIPLLAAVLLFGVPAAVLFFALVGAFGEIIRRKEPIRAVFNWSQYLLSTVLAGSVYTAQGGQPLAPSLSLSTGLESQIGPFVGFGLVFLAVNHAAVSIAIALSQGIPIRRAWEMLAGRSGSNLLYDVLISPIALAVAFLYVELGILGLLVALLPLLFIRHAYLTTFKLQQANKNLLKALIKAIETRDPYTSGHSRRVSSLARRIAEGLHLSRRQAELVQTAALLHDIGKIDAVYSEILRKTGQLSMEERRVIESHVTRGVELLQQLGSFPKELLDAVRHHHERVDGRGYPGGLRDTEIPLAARIIKVCDAVDAMLSDRPYRKALSLAEVRQQLAEYSGVQFDHVVVAQVVESGILEDHLESIRTFSEDDWLESGNSAGRGLQRPGSAADRTAQS